MTPNCRECGKKFPASGRRARYCAKGYHAATRRRKSLESAHRSMEDPEKHAAMLARAGAWNAAHRNEGGGRVTGRRRRRRRHRRPRPPHGQAGQYYTPQSARGAMGRSTACRLCGRSFAPYGGVSHHAYCERCTAKADREVAGVQRIECRECGKKFPSSTRSVRYCSDACRASSRRRLNAEAQRRYMADPEKRAMSLARTRTSSAARKARAQGKKRPPAGRSPGTAGRSPRGAKRPAPSTCRLCGRTFAQYGYHRTNYCKRCRARIDRKISTVLDVGCRECGKRFSTKNPLAKYCSVECRNAARRHKSRGVSRRSTASPEEYARMLARHRAWDAANRNKGGR